MNFQILIKLKDLSKNKTPTDMNNMQKIKKVPVLAYIKHPHYLHSDLGEEHPLCS